MKRPLTARLRDWARTLKRDGLTLWFACRHPATPWWVKAFCVFIVGYALSPIDLVPDFIPVLGYVDDVLLLPGLIWLALKLLPPAVRAECRQRADDWVAQRRQRPRSWWGAALIVLLWGAVLWGGWHWWSGRA